MVEKRSILLRESNPVCATLVCGQSEKLAPNSAGVLPASQTNETAKGGDLGEAFF